MATIPFEARRFQSTVSYYLRYRVPYPDALIARIAERSALQKGDRVLDLGCGPGQLGIAFAKLGAKVTAMDPEPEMLAAARDGAARQNAEIELRQGSSYDLNAEIGRLHLAVMGRSFHWMDRPATLVALDELIDPKGAIVLFDDRNIAVQPDWRTVVQDLARTFSPERNADRERRKSREWQPHEAILLHSPFRRLERIGIVGERRLEIDDIVGRTFSTSVTSPQALGDRALEFETALRAELGKIAPDGRFSETVEVSGLLAFRD